MKLSSMFAGKLVRGIKGKVAPVFEQDNPEEPIGIIRGFELVSITKQIVPRVLWIGQIEHSSLRVHPDNLQELEE